MSNFFGTPCLLDLSLSYQPNRRSCFLDFEKKSEKVYIYSDGEPIEGIAVVSLKPGKKLDHSGIKVEVIGKVSVPRDASPSYTFFTLSKDLEPPGALLESKSFKWKFAHVDKIHESYKGQGVVLRYFARLSLGRPFVSSLTKEVDFAVQNCVEKMPTGESIKMEVGIEDCLHIEFEYNKSHYHLKDVVVGKVYFLLVRIKIKYMELDIVKTETVNNTSGTQHVDTDTVAKFQIMDGAATKNECIPVRLYLSGYRLTPTYKNVLGRFSVKYFLNLVLVDEEERRYFKKQEIILYRT